MEFEKLMAKVMAKTKKQLEDVFYEIEYDACPMPGVGKFVPKSRKVEKAPTDPVRDRFYRMREIGRENRCLGARGNSFYDGRVRQEYSKVFYLQGQFMADFEDEYDKSVPYSSYYPDYHTMGYDQLRTYFTWRTRIRNGFISGTSTSYAFVYLYELLNNIGVETPLEGLEQILSFWEAFRMFDVTVDKYVVKWLKDYHIYYDLPHSFQEFVEENQLREFYPDLEVMEDRFALLCSLSKYDLRKSVFYKQDEKSEKLIRDCFSYMMERLEEEFRAKYGPLEDLIFRPAKSRSRWIPFQEALFYSDRCEEDKRIVISKKEIYTCSGGLWNQSTVFTMESGKRLMGYCMKQMEALLRKAVKYRNKLSGGQDMLGPALEKELKEAGISLEELITGAVEDFYRESTRTVVQVEEGVLEKIRREALFTQEKLTVPEEDPWEGILRGEAGTAVSSEGIHPGEAGTAVSSGGIQPGGAGMAVSSGGIQPGEAGILSGQIEMPERSLGGEEASAQMGIFSSPEGDPWGELGAALTCVEREALGVILASGDLKAFSDLKGVMVEVLAEGINEKAMDLTGDGILDEEFALYEDYRDQVERMLEGT